MQPDYSEVAGDMWELLARALAPSKGLADADPELAEEIRQTMHRYEVTRFTRLH